MLKRQLYEMAVDRVGGAEGDPEGLLPMCKVS